MEEFVGFPASDGGYGGHDGDPDSSSSFYVDSDGLQRQDMITAGMDTTVISVEWAKEAARGDGPCRWP
ncbi:hypothetical protein GUJ93_ZPchr0013g34086 [Zizania palustris]|uniref:Uncharacterized protein n=1 Tax=Zizania palustris TaxID=103762 RepID=A0A8J5X2P3_ZIZPA|nr:hypothetical protein GUJ93_ZPchr0013g34086 [Zizania palustris]